MLTITDGMRTTTVSVTAGQTSASFSLTDASGTGSHIVTVSGLGYSPVSQTYTAPLSCTVAPALGLTAGTCSTATNTYDVTGTISLTASVASLLTITDGSATTTVSVTAGQTSASFSLSSLVSGTGIHIVTVSGLGYTPVSATYAAPASCTVCSLSLTTTSLPNGQVGTAYSQTLQTSGASGSVTYTLIGIPTGSIGSIVWVDLDHDGQRDTGEPGVDGVTVRLLVETTPGTYTVVSTTVTSGGGKYLFTDLPAGTYVVEFDKRRCLLSICSQRQVRQGYPVV